MSALAYIQIAERHQCRGPRCLTTIPADRDLCYFCAKRVPPRPIASPHPECHITTPSLVELYELIIQPLTMEEIANQLHYSRRTLEDQWSYLRSELGLGSVAAGPGVDRLRILRMSVGLDPCFCR